MADENQPQSEQPQVPVGDNPTPIDPTTAPQPLKETQAKTVRELRAATVPPEQLPEGAKELVTSEAPEDTEARRAVEDTLNKPIEAVEDAVNAADVAAQPQTPLDVLPHIIGPTTDFFGHIIPIPVYDVVFISLAIFTVIEVITGTLLPHIWLTIAVLVVIAFVKAFHVVWFYMHLSTDNRIFWLTLMLPFLVACLGLLYLAAVPPTGY